MWNLKSPDSAETLIFLVEFGMIIWALPSPAFTFQVANMQAIPLSMQVSETL